MDTGKSTNQEKMHYESLIKLFTNALMIFTAAATIFGTCVGVNVYSLTSQASEQIKGTNARVDSVLAFSAVRLDRTQEDAQKQFENYQELTELRLAIIDKEAKLEALAAVKLKVEHEISSAKVGYMIDNALDSRIRPKLDDLAKATMKEAKSEFVELSSEVSRLSLASRNIIFNDVSAFKMVDSLRITSKIPEVRTLAQEHFENAINTWTGYYGFKDKNVRAMIQYRELHPEIRELSETELLENLLKTIFEEVDSEKVTAQFYTISDLLDNEIKPFEFYNLNVWVEQRKSKKKK